MKLQWLRLEQVRRFRAPLEIPSFEPGLNLFTGPNEAGKSTIVRALRAAFFERYRSTVIDDLIPAGETAGSVSPTIALRFESAGVEYELSKTFFARKRCSLRVGSQKLEGEAAEEALSTLLGFNYAGKGASKPEHWGIPGLLWVQQGDGQQIDEPVRSAADFLRVALESTVGAVASTAGDAVLASLRDERGKLLTQATGKPRGVYEATARELAEARSDLVELDRQIQTYQADVDQLGQLRQEHQAEASTRPWEDLEARLLQARQVLQAARQLSDDLGRQQSQRGAIQASLAAFEDRLQTFASDREQLLKLEADRLAAEQARDAAAATLTLREQQRQRVALNRARAERRVSRAEREAARQGLAEALARADRDEAGLAERLEQAEQQALVIARLAAEFDANRIDEAALEALQRSVAQLREREITLRAAATAIRLALQTGPVVRLDGAVIAAVGEHRINAAAKLEIDGVGVIEVIPGGSEAAGLASAVEAARAERDRLLTTLALPSLDAALQRRERLSRGEAELLNARRLLELLVPEGLDKLRQLLAAARTSRDEARRQVEALAGAESPADDLTVPGDDAEAPSGGLQAERMALKAIVDEGLRLSDVHLKASMAAATAAERYQGLQGGVEQARARIEDPASREREVAARAERDRAVAQLQQADTAIAALQARIATSPLDLLEQDVLRLERSRDQALQRHNQRELAISALQGRLEAEGANGLEARRAERQVEAAALERRHAELALRARALDLLVTQLQAGREAQTAKLQAPLQRHLDRYLHRLFADGSLTLNDSLIPAELARGQADTVSFAQLSYGAREQIALISRLAYADLLREAGKPTLIVLDDALVHSDARRIEPMQGVLFDAATRHQILLFTCHPERWGELGVAARDIGALQTG